MKKLSRPVMQTPTVRTPTIRIPQPDGGILFRAGKPTVVEAIVMTPTVRTRQPDGSILYRAGQPVAVEDLIGASEAAKILGMSRRWVETECILGHFKTARKPGLQPRSRWKIARSEVFERLQNKPE
jgi:hypothetical protein